MNLICLVCLYVPLADEIDPDSRHELEMLTIINGQLVCVRHASCVCEDRHNTIKAGVLMESGAVDMSLSQWQDRQSRKRRAALG